MYLTRIDMPLAHRGVQRAFGRLPADAPAYCRAVCRFPSRGAGCSTGCAIPGRLFGLSLPAVPVKRDRLCRTCSWWGSVT